MDTQKPSVFSISPLEFNARLGRADAPLVLDVRREARFAESPRLLAGAVRCAPEDVASLIAASKPRDAAVYCVYGHNVSEDAVAALCRAGWNARSLAGGFEGGQDGVDAADAIAQWRACPPISCVKRPDWGVTGERASRWITRERPKVDRIACPWLIRRFIDPTARFLFVTPAEVPSVAERFDAIPYDIEGVTFSHRDERCSFDALLDDFGLHCDPLDRMATVIRAADTDRHDLAPQAAGLLALSVGLSRMYREDLQQLEAGIALYDALYRWARDAHEEGHDWPAGRKE